MTFIYVGVSLQLFASAIPFIEEGGKNEGWLCWLAGIDRPHLKAAETRVGVSFLSSNGVGLLDRTLMFLPQKCEEGLNERTALFFFLHLRFWGVWSGHLTVRFFFLFVCFSVFLFLSHSEQSLPHKEQQNRQTHASVLAIISKGDSLSFFYPTIFLSRLQSELQNRLEWKLLFQQLMQLLSGW